MSGRKPEPCPICGSEPEIDFGLSDAPSEMPYLTCPTVHIVGGDAFSCPVHAQGIAAWNYLCRRAVFQRPPPQHKPNGD